MIAAARTFRVDLAYDGGEFVGSQRQPGARTVQGMLEQALEDVTGQTVAVALAGRTDRGVHAMGQVASVQVVWPHPDHELARALQAVTPDDLLIRDAREVDERFHARFDAIQREYRYRIWSGSAAPLLIRRSVWWVRGSLDQGRMSRAAARLIGRTDFASFAGDGVGIPGSGVDTVRTVSTAAWRRLPDGIERGTTAGQLLEFRIEADGFLPHMVRNVVGALVQVGRGRREPEWLAELLEARDRRLAPEPAPATGLVLWRVRYRDDDEGVAVDTDVGGILGVESDENVFTEGE